MRRKYSILRILFSAALLLLMFNHEATPVSRNRGLLLELEMS